MPTDKSLSAEQQSEAQSRRDFLTRGAALAATAATTAGLASEVLAGEIQLANADFGASGDAQGGGIDNSSNPLSIEELDAQIRDVSQQIDVLEADLESLSEEQWIELDGLYQRLAELENQKQDLGQQILAEENQIQTQNEAIIDAERTETAQNEVAIKNYDQAIENLSQVGDVAGDN